MSQTKVFADICSPSFPIFPLFAPPSSVTSAGMTSLALEFCFQAEIKPVIIVTDWGFIMRQTTLSASIISFDS